MPTLIIFPVCCFPNLSGFNLNAKPGSVFFCQEGNSSELIFLLLGPESFDAEAASIAPAIRSPNSFENATSPDKTVRIDSPLSSSNAKSNSVPFTEATAVGVVIVNSPPAP